MDTGREDTTGGISTKTAVHCSLRDQTDLSWFGTMANKVLLLVTGASFITMDRGGENEGENIQSCHLRSKQCIGWSTLWNMATTYIFEGEVNVKRAHKFIPACLIRKIPTSLGLRPGHTSHKFPSNSWSRTNKLHWNTGNHHMEASEDLYKNTLIKKTLFFDIWFNTIKMSTFSKLNIMSMKIYIGI